MTSRGPFQNSIFSVSMPDILTRVMYVCMYDKYVCMYETKGNTFLKSLQTTIFTSRDITGMFVASRILLHLHTGI